MRREDPDAIVLTFKYAKQLSAGQSVPLTITPRMGVVSVQIPQNAYPGSMVPVIAPDR